MEVVDLSAIILLQYCQSSQRISTMPFLYSIQTVALDGLIIWADLIR
jgi:hypothetical protein